MSHRSTSRYSYGQWQVMRERLRIADPVPPPDSTANPLGNVLPLIMKKLGLESNFWLQTLKEEWPGVVGGGVAAHAKPGTFDNHRLVVYVDSPVWLHELSRAGGGPMLRNLRERYGPEKIREIRFQLDPD